MPVKDKKNKKCSEIKNGKDKTGTKDYKEIDREGGRVLVDDDSNALRDEYMNDRPAQPEYISDEPEFLPNIDQDPDFLDENAIIEEDIMVVGDATDGRQRPKGDCGCKK